MNVPEYVANLSCGRRVRFVQKEHPRNGQICVVIRILLNPSGRPEHQWYDVRFADSSIGRFLQKYLEPLPVES